MLFQDVQTGSTAGPFAALSLIVAPAILTNACSLIVMSTSNRLARAVDLARQAARELEGTRAESATPETERRLREMAAADRRSLLLVRALRSVYAALAGFAMATFVSLIGVVFAAEPGTARRLAEVVALAAGLVGVGGLVWAATLLVRETRIAVAALGDRIVAQQARFASRTPAS